MTAAAVPAEQTFHEPGEAYAGTARLRVDDQELVVRVDLRGHFEPIDGRFHWYGRIADDRALADVRSGTSVTLTTDHGSTTGRLSDVDPWGRFRISGLGSPPF